MAAAVPQSVPIIRLATAADIPELADLYRQTVLTHAPRYYSAEQTQAWAAAPADRDRFTRFILAVTTVVIADETGILGFAGIGTDGHVASVYVRGDRLGHGLGSMLMAQVIRHAEAHGLPRLSAEASEFSRGLFEKFGFQQVGTEVVQVGQATFTRYLMERCLTEDRTVSRN